MHYDDVAMEPGRLVDVVHHLAARHQPTVAALRLIAEGTLPAYSIPGRPGWWVEPRHLDASLTRLGSGPPGPDVSARP